MPHCAYGLCYTDTRYLPKDSGIKSIPFPKPKTNFDACIRWINACGRARQINKKVNQRYLTPETVNRNT